MIKLAFVLVVIYLFFAGMLFVGQRGMMYFPSPHVPSKADLQSEGLQFWPEVSEYRGFTQAESLKDTHAVVVHFHGNASLAHDRHELAMSLNEAGFQVIMAEYPGYGGRPGTPTESTLTEDAAETVRLAAKQFGLPVYLWGESLGSGVAAGVISLLSSAPDDVSVEGVVLQVPFNSMAKVAQHHYWYLPARFLLKDKFNSDHNLGVYSGRVAVLVAENDQVVPAQFGISLFDSINTTKKLWMVNDAEHYFPADHSAFWWQEVLDFIEDKCDETEREC